MGSSRNGSETRIFSFELGSAGATRGMSRPPVVVVRPERCDATERCDDDDVEDEDEYVRGAETPDALLTLALVLGRRLLALLGASSSV